MRSTTSLTLRVATVLTAVPVALVLAAGSASAAPRVDGPAAERAASAASAAAAQVQRPAVAKAPKPATASKPTTTPKRAKTSKPAKTTTSRRAVASPELRQPQPLSKADLNGTGANPGEVCDHSYCSTRDGSPSRNGNGGGLASGKPCAGCVGKADNKNPQGQAVDGTDANNGYECDGNSGIARTNPAHTGCTTPVETTPVETTPVDVAAAPSSLEKTCPSGEAMPADGDCPPALGGTTLQAAGRPVFGPPTGLAPTAVAGTLAPAAGSTLVAQGAVAPTLLPDTAVSPDTLPFTGTDAGWLAQLAALLLLVGTALVVAGRRARVVR